MTNTGSGQHHLATKATTFLVIVALLAAIVGCVEGAGFQYDLTVSSTAGGWVTSPGQGSFTYDYGTVVATGWNAYGQCEVGDWADIIKVAAGEHHTVGLESGGTALAAGDNLYGQCDVSDWTDVVQIDAGKLHTVGLRSDGTVVAVGWNACGQCDVGEWELGAAEG